MRSVVRIYPGPPSQPLVPDAVFRRGAVAQLGEHLLCKQGVNGSIPFSSTISHSLFPVGRLVARQDADPEIVQRKLKGFQASGLCVAKTRHLKFFDNEIDWVIQGRARLAAQMCSLESFWVGWELFEIMKSVFRRKAGSA